MESYQKKGLNMEQAFGLSPTALISLYEIYYLEGYQDVDLYENRNYALRFCSVDHLSTVTATTAANLDQNGLKWAGLSYVPVGVTSSNFASSSQGLPRPLLNISNVNIFSEIEESDHRGVILEKISTYNKYFNDMTNARVVRRRVFAKFLDGDNFPENNNVNPWGTRDAGSGSETDSAYEFSTELYFISKKANETKESVEYELTSSLDVENVTIPNRSILGTYCSWCYRGEGCYFSGPPVSTELDDTDFMMAAGQSYANAAGLSKLNTIRSPRSGGSSEIGEFDYTAGFADWVAGNNYNPGDIVKTPPSSDDGGFVEGTKKISLVNGKIVKKHDITLWVCVTSHLSALNNAPEKKTGNWVADQCSKTVEACKLRFRAGYTGNKTLRFGGFPATEGYETDN